jgi:hypothetical protein
VWGATRIRFVNVVSAGLLSLAVAFETLHPPATASLRDMAVIALGSSECCVSGSYASGYAGLAVSALCRASD